MPKAWLQVSHSNQIHAARVEIGVNSDTWLRREGCSLAQCLLKVQIPEWVFGVNPAFNCAAIHLQILLFECEFFALCYSYRSFTRSSPCYQLSYWMLDLQARIDFDKVKVALRVTQNSAVPAFK